MLYVYAISDSTPAVAPVGLQGARLRAVGEGALFAMVSDHGELPQETAEEDLWAHEGAVEELMRGSTILPMRFGSTVPDQTALEEILERRRQEFASLIEGLRGAVELGVRARLPISDGRAIGDPSPGRAGSAYMLELAERERGASEAISRIHEPLASLARRSRRMPRGLRRGMFKAAYLVDRDLVEPFRGRIDELAAQSDGVKITCTGPWPPYSFSSEEAS